MDKKQAEMDEEQAEMDTRCKKVLSYPWVLAWILHDCFEEFKAIDIGTLVQKHLLFQVKFDRELDDNSFDVLRQIQGLNTENNSGKEGKVCFDLYFPILLPGQQGQMLVDIEAQGSFYPYKRTILRPFYYLGRMISSQKNQCFFGINYEDILKTSTIWIYTNSPKNRYNRIERIDPVKKIVSMPDKDLKSSRNDSQAESDQDWKQASIVLIYLPHALNQHTCKTDCIGLLHLLLSGKYTLKEIEYWLKKKYKFPVSQTFRNEVKEMCTYSQGLIEKGIVIGKKEGILIGKEEGILIGKEEGILIGKELAEAQAQKRYAIDLYKNGADVELISKSLYVSVEQIAQWLAQEKK